MFFLASLHMLRRNNYNDTDPKYPCQAFFVALQ